MHAAERAGLPLNETEDFLRGNLLRNEVLDQVVNQHEKFKTQTGVPHFKFAIDNGAEFELPGAQDQDYFERLLNRLIEMSLDQRVDSSL